MYEALFGSLLFPTYERLRGRKLHEYLKEYRRTQWLSATEIKAIQTTKLRELIQYCHEHVPYYRRLFSDNGVSPDDIQSAEDLRKLPVLTKKDIRDNFDDLIARPYQGEILKKSTGGSTGVPLTFGYTRESHDRRTAVMWRGYEWAGSVMGRKTLYLWGTAVGNPSKSSVLKENLYNRVFGRTVLDSFRMTDSNISDYIDAIERLAPKVIVTYVMPMVRLAEHMLSAGIKLSFTPMSILTGAEALHEPQREVIEAAFGCPVYNTYGSREFMLIASECEQKDKLHINSDHLVVEVTDKSGNQIDKEAGEILITDLHNYGMPFIRYQNGDVGTLTDAQCACGRGLPMMESVSGRILDMLISPDGKIIPGEFFPHMIKEIPAIQQFQVIQDRTDRLRVLLVTRPEYGAEDEAFLRTEARKVIGSELALDVELVDEIPLTSSGKHRVTINKIAAAASVGAG